MSKPFPLFYTPQLLCQATGSFPGFCTTRRPGLRETGRRLVEEDLRNEVGAKYTFLNWPIDIDACSHRSFDTQVDCAFNEFFSSFNPFNHILLVFILFVQPVEILGCLRNDDGYENVT